MEKMFRYFMCNWKDFIYTIENDSFLFRFVKLNLWIGAGISLWMIKIF